MNDVSSERVKQFRVASFVSFLPVFVCICPLRLQILPGQERLENVADAVGKHLCGGVYYRLRGLIKNTCVTIFVCIIRFAAVRQRFMRRR